MSSSSRRLLNRWTHSSVAYSTAASGRYPCTHASHTTSLTTTIRSLRSDPQTGGANRAITRQCQNGWPKWQAKIAACLVGMAHARRPASRMRTWSHGRLPREDRPSAASSWSSVSHSMRLGAPGPHTRPASQRSCAEQAVAGVGPAWPPSWLVDRLGEDARWRPSRPSRLTQLHRQRTHSRAEPRPGGEVRPPQSRHRRSVCPPRGLRRD